MDEIKKVLDRFDCVLVPSMIAEPGRMDFFVKTIAKPRDQRTRKQVPPMPKKEQENALRG
jgi:hypothetical protein